MSTGSEIEGPVVVAAIWCAVAIAIAAYAILVEALEWWQERKAKAKARKGWTNREGRELQAVVMLREKDPSA